MAVELIYCADGNSRYAQAAIDRGWAYGARLPGTVYHPIDFADQDWKEPDRARYMQALAKHRPGIATVLDLEREEQFAEVMSWAEEAGQFAGVVVVIPKVPGILDQIPWRIGDAEVRLGYSVPTAYGATPVPLWEFGRRQVHLLGGSPQRQIGLSSYLNVASADGNMALKQSHRCRFWSRRSGPKGHWTQLRDVGCDTQHDAHYQAFCRSLEEIQKAWKERRA